ncbi:MAG: hypothetical protein O2856_03560 [Planctomycetota bacterium]|nr:hypothetical protein [Planctomycetota bacterium]
MAKKKASSQKPSGEAVVATTEDSAVLDDAPKTATPAAKAPPSKTKVKANDDQASNGNVGIGDIKKAVAFANSVGGLDKAISLLQILKVAKDVQ